MRLRHAVLAVALCALATPTFAQGTVFGVKGGITFPSLSFDDEDGGEASSRTSYAIGAFVGIPITPMISVQPEFLWAPAGTEVTGPELGGETGEVSFNQVQVPVLLKTNIGKSSTRPFVVVGPVFGFKASKLKIKVGDFETDDPADTDDDTVSSTDVAIAFGGGVDVGKLSVEVRYNLGVKDLDTTNSSVKSRSLMLLAGFSF
jgi:opacity protein-like surface antigen